MNATLELPLGPIEKAARKATWLETALTQYPIIAPQLPDEFSNNQAHDLFQKVKAPDGFIHPNWYGTLFRKLQAKGLIQFAGYTKSTRKERKGGVVALWRKVK